MKRTNLRSNWARLLVIAAIGLLPAAKASVIYVRAGASGLNNGTSWADAYVNLQSALAVAQVGDEIWVAAGVYKPDSPGGARSTSFEMRSEVATYGGFAGTETQLEQRDFTVNVTELSGDIDGDDPTTGNNSYHVLRATALAPGTVLDGLTIRSGNSSGSQTPVAEYHGAGLRISGGALTVRNCIFRDNTAWNGIFNPPANNGGNGGGAYVESANVEFVNCRFENNRAGRGGNNVTFQTPGNGGEGGAVYSTGSNLQCTNCTFVNNRAGDGGFASEASGGTGGHGGAIRQLGQRLTLDSCTFTGNLGGAGAPSGQDSAVPSQGGSGGAVQATGTALIRISGGICSANISGGGRPGNGGAFSLQGSDTRVSGVIFSANAAATGGRAGGNGGAMYLESSALQHVEDCTFSANLAGSTLGHGGVNSAGNGGAVVAPGQVFFARCLFTENRAGNAVGISPHGGSGGALDCGATTILQSTFRQNVAGDGREDDGMGGAARLSGQSLLVNCLFFNNQTQGDSGTGHGGAIRTTANLTLINCTIARNGAWGAGGGVSLATATPALNADNCIFWNNNSGGFSEAAQIAGFSGNDTVDYCIVQGLSGAFGGVGNSAADPQFEDELAGDFRLAAGSPAIDAGNNVAVPAGTTMDVFGNPRFVDAPATPDTGAGTAPIVDIGAAEFGPCFADLDGNREVNLGDLAELLSQFGSSGSGLTADLDQDNDVDLADLAALLSQFGGLCP